MTVAERLVLVVDDDPDIRAFVRDLLLDEGYAVQTAKNGREALETLRAWHADLILLDLAMPEMDGWAFLTRRQDDPELTSIPVVVMSAQHHIDRGGSLTTAQAVLPKPFSIEQLLVVAAGLLT